MAQVERRYTFQEATEQLGGISKSTLLNWIAKAGLREAVDEQVMDDDQRVHYLTRGQLEYLAVAHRRPLVASALRQSKQEPQPPTPATSGTEGSLDFSGIWHSVYTYTSSTQPGTFLSEYDVRIHRIGNHLIIESLANKERSYLVAHLDLDGRIATGTYEEHTSPITSYEGKTYRGALQLIVDDDGNAFRGKYVAFSRTMVVFSNDWVITRLPEEEDLGQHAKTHVALT